MVDKQITLIKAQIEKINDSDFDLSAWKSSTILILDRIFGSDYQGIKAIEKIRYNSSGISNGHSSAFWDNMDSCKKQAREILETCLMELETFGVREQKQMANNGININLTQNQSVNINLLISAIKDELTGAQMKEVEEIMNSPENQKDKKNKIFDKIKSFGVDVASNVLANILTNPAIWG